MTPPSLTIRSATTADFGPIWDIRYANDITGATIAPRQGPPPPYLRHLRDDGILLVAETDGAVVGYAGRLDRGGVAYLTDLFIDPARQSTGTGGQLLRQIFAGDAIARCTLATADPRALALYTRFGMAPRWPNFTLTRASALGGVHADDVTLAAVDMRDPDLHRWDGAISGRFRPADLAFFEAKERGRAFWVRRMETTIGYAIVRLGSGGHGQREVATIGPVGAWSAADALACVLAATAWAGEQGAPIELAVPGPHRALAPLLSAGFRITDVETYCASEPTLLDPERYVGSGGDLF
jgi:GNAT superfamily N-acetyltransferase